MQLENKANSISIDLPLNYCGKHNIEFDGDITFLQRLVILSAYEIAVKSKIII